MKATRRTFVKAGIIAGAGMGLPGAAFAALNPEAAGPETTNSMGQLGGRPIGASPTRGVGLYPGAPEDDFAPHLVADTSGTERNLALRRPAFHSSSYDYNLTAQLVTDGIVDNDLPDWLTTVVNGEILPKPEREILVNHFQASALEIAGSKPVVELHLGGGATLPEVDRIDLFVVAPQHIAPSTLIFTISTSADGHQWNEVGSVRGGEPLPTENYPPDLVKGTHLLGPSIPFNAPGRARYYRVEFGVATTSDATAAVADSVNWRFGPVAFYRGHGASKSEALTASPAPGKVRDSAKSGSM